jgi:hypothetical protein
MSVVKCFVLNETCAYSQVTATDQSQEDIVTKNPIARLLRRCADGHATYFLDSRGPALNFDGTIVSQ